MKDEVLREGYWSKADAFLLPLTGLKKTENYEMRSYLFWRDYEIHNYNLILCFSYENLEEFTEYCKKEVFPILDKHGYILENYDIEGRSIFVLDMSEWAMDIQMFILGKYSKMTEAAKIRIRDFHLVKGVIKAYLYGVIYPNEKLKTLGNDTFMEYVAKYYDIDMEDMKKLGETGSIYDRTEETLLTDVEELCQTDVKAW